MFLTVSQEIYLNMTRSRHKLYVGDNPFNIFRSYNSSQNMITYCVKNYIGEDITVLRFIFVIAVSIPFIILLYAKAAYMDAHDERYTEEERYKFARMIANTLRRNSNIRTEVYGKENLPEEGGYVMYANHQGKYDAVGIIYGHERPCTVVMDDKRSRIPVMKPYLKVLKGSTLDKTDIKSQANTIRNMVKEIKSGRRYIMFPEGGYNHNRNNVQDFMPGAFKCSVRSKTPIVPVALIDSYKPFELNSLRRVTTQVHFLKPISYEKYKELTTDEIAYIVREQIVTAVTDNLR